MGRRSDHTREELTKLALDAGHELLAGDGLSALTVRAVAARIGYSPGTIYNLFADFDEFLLAVNARTLDMLETRVSSLDLTDDIARNLHALLSEYVRFARDFPECWSAVLEYNSPHDQLPDWYNSRIERLMALIETALGSDIPAGLRRSMAIIAWTSAQGMISFAGEGKLRSLDRPAMDQLSRDLVSCLAAGFSELARTGSGPSPDRS